MVACSLAYSQTYSTARTTTDSGGYTIGNCDLDDLILGVMIASSSDSLHREGGLLTSALVFGDATPGEGPFIGILRSKVVCTAGGTERGKISSVSVVVNYVCQGPPFCIGIEERTEQFQFDCIEDNTWDPRIVDGHVRSFTGSFDTTRSDVCGQCIDPHSLLNPLDPRSIASNPDNHCAGQV